MSELVIHPSLSIIEHAADGYLASFKNLRFIVSELVELDGKRWLHASVSRDDRSMPSYGDLQVMKRLCIGEHRTALQVFPPSDQHIDWAGPRGTQVLHLWSCSDGDVTPDFSRGNGII